MSNSGTISITVDIPVRLTIGGQTFNVQTELIGADRTWTPPLDNPDIAFWVYGSVVNYVIGMPEGDQNRALLEQLAPGDEFTMTTRGGVVYTFAFSSRENVPANNDDVFAQNRPGITLLLLGGEGNERLVLRGRYVVNEADDPVDNIVNMAETAQLGSLQITVNSTTFIADRPEIPTGFAFFLVDYVIQNVGLTALDTASLQFTLVDALGNQYALSPAASRLGSFAPLAGFLNANQLVEVSAGYQVPLGLDSETVNWIVTQTNTGSQLFVTLPYSGDASAATGTSISLFRADVSPDFTSLILGGQVTNLGTQPVVVTEGDVILNTNDGATYLLLSTNPPFPWTISPGQTTQFFLTYQRPPDATARFTVLNQSFELTSLR
jgi:hypothetical protein